MKQYSHLRVINKDIIQPETGFPMHPHHHMEILIYIIDGAISNTDSIENMTDVTSGDIQIMGEWFFRN